MYADRRGAHLRIKWKQLRKSNRREHNGTGK